MEDRAASVCVHLSREAIESMPMQFPLQPATWASRDTVHATCHLTHRNVSFPRSFTWVGMQACSLICCQLASQQAALLPLTRHAASQIQLLQRQCWRGGVRMCSVASCASFNHQRCVGLPPLAADLRKATLQRASLRRIYEEKGNHLSHTSPLSRDLRIEVTRKDAR